VKTTERDVLLLMLAAASGSADGWSYFGIAHAFVANMTGNTVLLGISVFQSHGDMLHPLLGIASYLAGTALGTLICRRVPEGAIWDQSTSWALFAEALLLLAAEAAWVAMAYHPSPRAGSILLATVAFAIGIQSGAMVQLRIPGVVTTYITGTWTTLTNGLVLLATRQPRVVQQETKFEKRFALQALVLAAYFLSAVLTGWAFRHAPAVVGGISAVAVLLAAGYGALRS
jgi:uncharacterized membrane protein YoaK (UPF0700 family)